MLRRLGKERLKPDGSVINSGMGPGVITIVFPNSRPGFKMPDEQTLKHAIDQAAGERFRQLGGVTGAPMLKASGLPSAAVAIDAGLAARIVGAAKQEMADYGAYTEGESPLRERIGVYWKAVGGSFDGSNHDAYWSAVFVSYMVREAGGAAAFKCSEQHSKYVHQAIIDRHAQLQGRFWAYRSNEIPIAPGDILAMNRGDARPIDFEEAVQSSDFPSHCDVVVEADGARFSTIGGNVGKSPGTVGAKQFKWKNGALVRADNPNQQVYAILRPPAI